MDTEKERLETAQWVLERNLTWIAAAEVKVGVVVAIDTAMLGALGAAYSTAAAAACTSWANVCTYGAAAAAICGLFCAAMAVLPRVNGPEKSLVFFGKVAKLTEADYVDQFKKATDAALIDDWAAQIHRNAQIACEKYSWVRASMCWSLGSVLPWLAAIIILLKK